MIYIFTAKDTALKKLFTKNAEFPGMKGLSKHSPGSSDLSYLDISGLTATETKKATGQFKKRCGSSPWGIIDPRGGIKDPSLFFFEGASDYLGPGALKGLSPKRLQNAAAWRVVSGSAVLPETKGTKGGRARNGGLPKTGITVPAAKAFPGWKTITPGKTMPCYLLYCSLHGKTALGSRLGEAAYTQLHQRFLACLYQYFQEADGLAWMDSGKDCLFLVPPQIKSAEAAVKACMRLLVSAPLIAIETLSLTVPATFVFALHYGDVSYRPPGKTGTVVSDAVNFIFHLGTKKAEPGRLTISGELPDNSVPASLEDFFLPSGEYEGRRIWHTKKFSYLQNWL